MKNKQYPKYIAPLICIFMASCHKDIQTSNQLGNTVTGNFAQVFQDYWTNMNNSYVFWDIDKTNWDQIYQTYLPKFSTLNLYDSADEATGYGYFKQIVDGLTDSHYTISFFDGSSIDPALDRKRKNPAFISNVFHTSNKPLYPDSNFYYTNFIDSNYLSYKLSAVDSLNGFYAISGLLNNSHTLYLAFSNFYLVTEYQTGPTKVKNVLDYFFSELSDPKITSLIIDLRGNTGGSISDLNFLTGSLISTPLNFGYTRSKNGNGRLDYTPWAPAIVQPRSGFNAFTQPIIVLADGVSVSMAELTTMALKQLPNTTFVGDTTWGANGPLTDNVRFNAGSFNFGYIYSNISSGSTLYYGNVYTSSNIFKYINGNIYEGKGFPPDYLVKITDANTIFLPNNKYVDPQLEKAITLLPK